MINSVKEFMTRAHQETPDRPTWPDVKTIALRDHLIEEEFEEYRQAIVNHDIVGVLDAVCDMLYVVIGAGIAFGLPINAAFRAVHENNMRKIDLIVSKDENGKVSKPAGHQGPNLRAILGQYLGDVK